MKSEGSVSEWDVVGVQSSVYQTWVEGHCGRLAELEAEVKRERLELRCLQRQVHRSLVGEGEPIGLEGVAEKATRVEKGIRALDSFVRALRPEVDPMTCHAHGESDGGAPGELGAVTKEAFPTTRAVPLSEVMAEPEQWRQPFVEEHSALLHDFQVMRKTCDAEIQSFKERGWTVERAPMKAVCTRKAQTGRRRARLVLCGNYLGPAQGGDRKGEGSPTLNRTHLYTPSLDATALRIQLKWAAEHGKDAGTTDISKAFLHAPLHELRAKKRLVVARSPRILERLGVLSQAEDYILLGALYGLDASPKAWGQHRDARLRDLRWTNHEGLLCKLVQLKTEPCLWRVVGCVQQTSGREQGSRPSHVSGGVGQVWETGQESGGVSTCGDAGGDESGQWITLGYLGVYVDDLLCTADIQDIRSVFAAIESLWPCSAASVASEGPLKFCGIQVMKVDSAYAVHQRDYIRELVEKHGVSGFASTPVAREEPPPEEEINTEALRAAQGLAGELLWCSSRCRPDLSFGVSRMSSVLSKAPKYAYECGLHMLRYLNLTQGYALMYCPSVELEGRRHHLPVRCASHVIEAYTDASFGPNSDRSQSGVCLALGGSAVNWMSCKQTCVSLSSTEAELGAASEGVVVLDSIGPLAEEIFQRECSYWLYNDNIACVVSLSLPSGKWRTRHLRLRGRHVQERVESEHLHLHHLPGSVMWADLQTKALPGPRVLELVKAMGFCVSDANMSLLADGTTCDAARSLEHARALTVLLAAVKTGLVPGMNTAGDDDTLPPTTTGFGHSGTGWVV